MQNINPHQGIESPVIVPKLRISPPGSPHGFDYWNFSHERVLKQKITKILEEKRIPLIRNGSTRFFPISAMFTKQHRPIMGAFSQLYHIKEKTPGSMIPEIENRDIIVKILKHSERIDNSHYLQRATIQYKWLERYFRRQGYSTIPLTTVYNKDTAKNDGYLLVEKVTPCHRAPWDSQTSLQNFSSEQIQWLKMLRVLLEANRELEKLSLQEREKLDQEGIDPHDIESRALFSGLDLKWNNLGKRHDGTPVLLDYVNIRYTPESARDTYAERLSGGNPEVKKYLEGLEQNSFQSFSCDQKFSATVFKKPRPKKL